MLGGKPEDTVLTVHQQGDVAVLEVPDSLRLRDICGRYDGNLAVMERSFGVTIARHGDCLHVSGGEKERNAASRAFEILAARVDSEGAFEIPDIDTAVRLAREPGFHDAAGQPRFRTRTGDVTARTPAQCRFMEALIESDLVFGIGPAGTGKTYLAVAAAVAAFLGGRVERIVLSRPAVEAGERLGFLPGDLKEKIDPYLMPLYDALDSMLTRRQVERHIDNGKIEIAPLAFMRGRTLSDAFVVLDEAQNCTVMQMKMFLTRLGENARMAVTGDLTQVDLPPGAESGLRHARRILGDIPGVSFINFRADDSVRKPLVKKIVEAYAEGAPSAEDLPNPRDVADPTH